MAIAIVQCRREDLLDDHLPDDRRAAFGDRLAQLPSALGVGGEGFYIELLLRGEIVVNTDARQTGGGHDLVNRNLGKSFSVEKRAGAFDDAGAGLDLVFGRIGLVGSFQSFASLADCLKMILIINNSSNTLAFAVIDGRLLFESSAIVTAVVDLAPDRNLIAKPGTWERLLHAQ